MDLVRLWPVVGSVAMLVPVAAKVQSKQCGHETLLIQ